MSINIAIDGPTAAGKSSISKLLAQRLNYAHIDTGSMYRSVAYKALSKNLSLDDEEAICEMLKTTSIKITPEGFLLLDGVCLNDEIRTNEMSLAASSVSKLKKVREYLVDCQKEMAKEKGYIMDGRDIGTVVLKDAELKIFLTATAFARANRRHQQNIEKKIPSDFEVLKKEIELRDYQDTTRNHSPLIQAEDAVLIDSSNLTIEQVVDTIFELVKQKGE
ncbi:MAG: (d)CMP kinase [Erysipelotrichaceae bacterium]